MKMIFLFSVCVKNPLPYMRYEDQLSDMKASFVIFL